MINYPPTTGGEDYSDLFHWLDSTAGYFLTKYRTSGTPLSLATCEKVPTSGENGVRNGGENDRGGQTSRVEEIDVAQAAENADVSPAMLAGQLEVQGGTAAEAVQAALSCDRERQAKVVECIRQAEVAHARRLATCNRQSVELRCAGWDGCGEHNYVPITCDSRLCEECGKRRQGQVIGKYVDRIRGWDDPTHMRLSLDRRVAPRPGPLTEAIGELRDAFGRLRRRVIQPSGEHQGDRWVWSIGDDGGEPADCYWKSMLVSSFGRDRVAYLESKYVRQGRGIPVDELLREGIYGIDAKQGDDGTINVHMHVLVDVPYLPQPALSKAWEELTGAPVVYINRVYESEDSERDALAEVTAYAAKAPEYETVKQEVAFNRALKGSKLIQPFGNLHGNTPDMDGVLYCCNCERAPALDWNVEWAYEGVVDGRYSTALVGAPDGDRPPPEEGEESAA
jgi:hypothetical protein